MVLSMGAYSALRCGGVFVYNAVESTHTQLRLPLPASWAYGEST